MITLGDIQFFLFMAFAGYLVMTTVTNVERDKQFGQIIEELRRIREQLEEESNDNE